MLVFNIIFTSSHESLHLFFVNITNLWNTRALIVGLWYCGKIQTLHLVDTTFVSKILMLSIFSKLSLASQSSGNISYYSPPEKSALNQVFALNFPALNTVTATARFFSRFLGAQCSQRVISSDCLLSILNTHFSC